MGKARLDTPRVPAVEPDRRAREIGEKAPVVADEHERGAPGIEISLQPFDRGEIEMIGRLVEEQDIGRGRQHASQRGAACLTAGKMRRVFLPVEAELIEELAAEVDIVAGAEAGFDIGKRRCEAGKIRLLRQIADHGPGLHENRAAIGFDVSGRDLEQGRFARAVASNESHPLAGGDG
jgi:hypothetical protein